MNLRTATICLLTIAFIFGCDREQNAGSGVPMNSLDHLNTTVNQAVPNQATLLQALPEQTVAYFRAPSFQGMFLQPQDDAIQPALLAEPMQQQTALIAQGLRDNLFSKIGNQAISDLLDLLLNKQAAPIEVAILAGNGGLMTPEILINTKFDLESTQELDTILNHLVSTSQGQLQLASEVDDQGAFKLSAAQMDVLGHFDADSDQFVLFTGPAVNESTFNSFRDGTLATRTDAYAFEQGIDSTGSNLAIWADTKTLWQQLSSLIPPNDRFGLEKLNLHNTEFFYAGSATKDGHGSFRVMLKQSGDSPNLLHIKSSDTVRNAGVSLPVKFAITLPFPNKDHLDQVFQYEDSFSSENNIQTGYNEIRETLLEQFELDLDQLLAVFGPSAVIVGDNAGMWIALPIEEADAFKESVNWTVEKFGAELNTENFEGIDITHYKLPSLTNLVIQQSSDLEEVENEAPWLTQLLAAESTHLYWHQEQSNLIIASVPQILMARNRHLSDYTLNDWLTAHEVDWNGSLLSVLMESNKLPERIYTFYLESIQMLSDVAGVDANLMRMPLAEDLQLPKQGRLGMQIKTAGDITSLQFDYEQSMIDYIWGGGGVAVVATAGVLAAIAIPAYQNYTVRAQVSETILSAAELKFMLADFYITNNRYPTVEEAETFYMETDNATISFDADSQVIEIVFNDVISEMSGDMVMLIPDVDEGGYFEWWCENVSADDVHVPAECR